jgi:hypothetical protein
MSARHELNSYLHRLRRRLRVRAFCRGAALLTASALVTTIVLVLAANLFAFSPASITTARVLLLAVLVAAAAIGLAIPLSRLTRHRIARIADDRFPHFQQRLVTFTERESQQDPFLELLAADTLDVAQQARPAELAPNTTLLAFSGIGLGSIAVLLWLILAGPGVVGYGSHLLWAGVRPGAAPLYSLQVAPGNATVRRNRDQLVTAQPHGLFSPQVRLFARYQSASKWDEVKMQPRPAGSGYQFVFAGLPENVEYYVQAGPLQSPHYTLHVVDLPAITRLKVTYHYPAWTGVKDIVDTKSGGDLRAVEGTNADLDVTFDHPLANGALVLDDGREMRLRSIGGTEYAGTIAMTKDGTYHVASLDASQPTRLSEDFFIEARKANPPVVRIARPGGDYRASPIEEVTIAADAQDEFGVKALDVHYSVNGGPEKVVPLLKDAGAKNATGSFVLPLEPFKLVPGDLVSLYATARDGRTSAHSDMVFVQADPYERDFSQSQQAGGAGGAGMQGSGDQPDQISQREKELIAATFTQQTNRQALERQAAETAKFLSESQATLRAQSLSLAGRLQARDLAGQNQEFSAFQKEMIAAAGAMDPAAQQLRGRNWREAIPDEQKALQHLLRAEATFRQIEVAFGAAGGAGGGGAGRDLASLFDLELDMQKNQYETQPAASASDQRAQQINDALKKLDEMARREEDLASHPRQASADDFEQRWQQEMLRRNAEQLRQQLEQQQASSSSSNSNSSASSSAASGSASASGASSQPGRSGQASQASSADRAAQQALQRLEQAQQDMQRAAANPNGQADARQAAQRLREAMQALGGALSQQAAGRLDQMTRDADRLSQQEHDQAAQLQQLKTWVEKIGSPDDIAGDMQKLANDRQAMVDDLAALQQSMRRAAGELSGTERATADQLRQALDAMNQSDLETYLQRSADWLRTGINPQSNGTESQIASGLRQLRQAMRQAQQALVPGGNGKLAQNSETDAALEQLRRQVDSLSRSGQGQAGASNQQGGTNQQGDASQQGGAQGAQAGTRGNGTDARGLTVGPRGAAGARGTWNGAAWIDTGNNAHDGTRAAAQPTPAGDPEHAIQQGVSELNRLRQQAPNDPAVQKQIQALVTAMEHLDLRRFPGNPAMVDELHQRLLSGIDTLELQLRRVGDQGNPGQVRSPDPSVTPSGYRDAVADYFRRLSGTKSTGGKNEPPKPRR